MRNKCLLGTYTSYSCVPAVFRAEQPVIWDQNLAPSRHQARGLYNQPWLQCTVVPLSQLASTDQGQHLFQPLPVLPPALPLQQLGQRGEGDLREGHPTPKLVSIIFCFKEHWAMWCTIDINKPVSTLVYYHSCSLWCPPLRGLLSSRAPLLACPGPQDLLTSSSSTRDWGVQTTAP